MKKKLLLAILVIVAAGAIFTLSNNESEIEILRKKHAEFLKNHPYNKTLALTKKERKANAIPPNKYFEQEYLLEMSPSTGKTYPLNYIEVQAALQKSRPSLKVPGDQGNAWVERGPNNVGGRTRVILFDPNDANHKRVFAGGVSGGLWVTNDITAANATWTRVGIDENLSVSCMTVDPNNSQIMYVGTGESQTGDDAVGNGVWKSIDGGSTWTHVFAPSITSGTKESRFFYINDIIAWNNPGSNQTEVFIGVAGAYYGEGNAWIGYEPTGLYKSINGGTSFSKITLPAIPGETSIYEPNDFETGADNTLWIGTERNAYGHGGGSILKSTDGTSFSLAYAVPNARRTLIATSKTNKDKLYVLATTPNSANKVQGFYTTNSFSSVTLMGQPSDADTDITAADFTRGQYWYDLVLEVDPVDDNKVYVGGIDLFRSTDLGANWKQISKWSNNNNLAALNVPTVHADQHSWAFHPTNPNIALIGNDGGVYYASSLSGAESTTTAIEAKNSGYNITQFYHGEIGQSAANELLVAGAQDNGTQFLNGATAGINSSTRVYGGDGAYSFIDKDGEYIIVSYVYNVKARLNLPYTGAGTTLENDQTTGSFINVQELDDNLDILYSNGSKTNDAGTKVYDSIIRYTGIKNGQNLVKKNIGNALLDGNSTALKVSPFTTTSTTLFVGTDTGKLLRVKNANAISPSWTNITGASFVGSISDIAFGANENEILVTFHNYEAKNIWYTDDGGITWQEKEGNFPDIPVKAIIMNPLNNNEVIIGTQLGVWRTGNFKDASPSWSHAYNGMSNVKVTSFDLRTADNTVLATTYGRGMFTGQFSAPAASVDDVLADTKVFTLYPTVSDGNFTLFAKNTLGKATMNIFDMAGKQVYTKKVDFNQNSRQAISVQLSSGVYIVNLLDENNKKSSGKLIIK
ncbi:hypothetical protein GCM10011416_06710 [Polaribacter pacificus]|uniref:Secretion system C-terminal sorting domain-containing protein n=1 Tax=Polaribacter pacificus TaxID=1775173 RepID=A0A917MBN0_9FLAO|nr:T9SS type A sorting domain-containing protein [Polaribacter pacificus]GGG92436.1 hypothetical protein GCM10011416_06710 [Polaribacter pacificus]